MGTSTRIIYLGPQANERPAPLGTTSFPMLRGVYYTASADPLVDGFVAQGQVSRHIIYTVDGYTALDYAAGVPAPRYAPVDVAVDFSSTEQTEYNGYDDTLFISVLNEGAATDTAAETQYYVYTLVNALGEESAPSPPSRAFSVVAGSTQIKFNPPRLTCQMQGTAEVWATGQNISVDSIDYVPVRYVRVYRSNTGSQTSVYQLVLETPIFPLGTDGTLLNAEYTTTNNEWMAAGWTPSDVTDNARPLLYDQVTGGKLTDALVTSGWDIPPPMMQMACVLPSGMMVGAGGRAVYASINGVYYAWPALYARDIQDEALAITAAGNAAVLLTRARPYLITGASGDAYEVMPLEFAHGCKSARAVATAGDTVFYVAAAGLCAVSSNAPPAVVTEALFDIDQWKALFNHSTSMLAVFDRKLFCFDEAGKGFIFDLDRRTFQPMSYESEPDSPWAMYACEADGALYFIRADFIAQGRRPYHWPTRADEFITPQRWTWTSKEFESAPMFYTWAQVLGTGVVRFELINEFGVPVFTAYPMSRNPFRLPEARSRSWRIRLTNVNDTDDVSFAMVRAVHLAHSAAELQ